MNYNFIINFISVLRLILKIFELLYGSIIKNGVKKMENEHKRQLLKTIGIIREGIQCNMQLSLESYSEILSKLDLLIYLILEK